MDTTDRVEAGSYLLNCAFPVGSDSKILSLRHFMHANPELSHEEHETQAKISEMLAAEGLAEPGIFHNTGLYIDIKGNADGPPINVVVRGDTDALPIQEARPDLPFQSCKPGKMHACGHDAHASAAFGVVLAALANRDSFAGTVRVIFQPGEEDEPLGGRAVSNLGLLEGFDYAVGMHVNPEMPSGTFAALSGAVTKSADTLELVFKGRKSHAAWPELGVDAITIASAFVSEIQKLISRESHPDEGCTISIGRFHGGEATNVVCDRVVLDGTLRTRSPVARSRLHGRIETIARLIAQMHQGEADVRITKGEPVVINDEKVSRIAREAIVKTFGDKALIDVRPSAGADDFGFFAEKLPSVYFWIGVRDESLGNVSHVHTPQFGVSDREVIGAARAAWSIVSALLRDEK